MDQVFDEKLNQIYLSTYLSELTRLDKKHVKIDHKFTLRQVSLSSFRKKYYCMERSGTESKAKQSRTTNCFCFSRDTTELFNLLFWTTLCFLEPQNFSFVAGIF